MKTRTLISKADVRMLLALGLTAVAAFLIITGQTMPEAFVGIWGMVMGYYFASRENGAERQHTEMLALGRRPLKEDIR